MKGLEKDEWIKYQIYTKGGSEEVTEFIADVVEVSGSKFNKAFAGDYSYYFASMLKSAFDRGEIYWHRKYHHIVWKDDDGKIYDANGVYENSEAEFVPFSHLGDMGQIFKMTKTDTIKIDCLEFIEWCNNKSIDPITTIMEFYSYSKEVDDKLDVITNALAFWRLHKDDLDTTYDCLKDDREV